MHSVLTMNSGQIPRLDPAQYVMFKMDVIKILGAKVLQVPPDLNAKFELANQWVKPVAKGMQGFVTTFATG